MKKAVGLATLILGAFIGAGFSSGREVYVFFARFGWLSIPMALLVGLCLYFLFFYFSTSRPDTTTTIFALFRRVIVLSTFVLCATMFAGCNTLSQSLGRWIIALTFAISLVLCFYRSGGLKLTNYILLPVILISIMLLVFVSPLSVCVKKTIFPYTNCLKYVGLNSILLSMFLLQLGDDYTVKEKKLASIISSSVLALFIIIISLLLMGAGDSVANSDMPLVVIAFSKSKTLGLVMSLVVWAGLVTTLVSGLYVVFGEIEQFSSRHSRPLSVLCVALTFALSFVGWDVLTTKVYALLGAVSVIVIVLQIVGDIKIKKTQKNRRG